MSSANFLSSSKCLVLSKNKVSSWLSFLRLQFKSIIGQHGVHELIITGTWSSKVSWDSWISVISSFNTTEVIEVGFETFWTLWLDLVEGSCLFNITIIRGWIRRKRLWLTFFGNLHVVLNVWSCDSLNLLDLGEGDEADKGGDGEGVFHFIY